MPGVVSLVVILLTVGVSQGYGPGQGQPQGHHHHHPGPSDLPRPVMEDPSASPCEERCEVVFPDGRCGVDADCLLRTVEDDDCLPEDGRCSGCCLYQDKNDRCRLDFVCLLQRNAGATLRFLRQYQTYSHVAEVLSEDTQRTFPNQEILLPSDDLCEVRQGQDNSCEAFAAEGTVDLSGTGWDDSFVDVARIIDPPSLDCPGRCEVRGEDGVCVVDVDCLRFDV